MVKFNLEVLFCCYNCEKCTKYEMLANCTVSAHISYFVITLYKVKQNNLPKIGIIFLSISLNMCFGCSKEPSHRDGSFEYPQHMFWLRNKKINFHLRTIIWGPALDCTPLRTQCFRNIFFHVSDWLASR